MGAEKNTQGEFYNFQFESFRNSPCANKGPNLGTNTVFSPRLQHSVLHKKFNVELSYYNAVINSL